MKRIQLKLRAVLAVMVVAAIAACADTGSNPLAPDAGISAAKAESPGKQKAKGKVSDPESGDVDRTDGTQSGYGLAWPF